MNVEGLLDFLGVDIATESKINYSCSCPFHSPDADPSFSIHREHGAWLCRAGCGSSKDPIVLIQRIRNCSYPDAKLILEEFCDPQSETTTLLTKKLDAFTTVTDDHKLIPQVELPSSFFSFAAGYKDSQQLGPYFNYIQTRLSEDSIYNFNIGYCHTGRYWGRIIIPIKMFGKNVGFLARSIHKEVDKRYLNATNVLYSNLLFNYDEAMFDGDAREIYLCESAFDAMTLYSYEIPAIATFGAHVSSRQMELLIAKKPIDVVICFHNDNAGNEEANRLYRSLGKYFRMKRLMLPPDTDINEMDFHDFQMCKLEDRVDSTLNRILGSIKWKMQKS